MERRKTVAVIGNGTIEKDGPAWQTAYETGKALVDAGYRIQSGGLGGVMQAAFKGAHASKHYREGDTIAIVPSFDRKSANVYADIVIPTGIDLMRNAIVANADAVIAVGGGAGTLCEIAYAWSMFRLILAYDSVEGWSSKLAGTRIDEKIRYKDIPDDRVYAVSSPKEAIRLLNEKIGLYERVHHGIKATGLETDLRV